MIKYFLILTVFIFCSCNRNPQPYYNLQIQNNSNISIFVTYVTDYPDTNSHLHEYGCGDLEIKPNTLCIAPYKSGWDYVFTKNNQGVIMFNVWGYKDTLVKKRYDLTLDSMIKNNWEIVYQ